MIGYYVHRQGRGHLHRALAVAQALDEPVTLLSSLSAPEGCRLPWVLLERDDLGPSAAEPTARGRLHWAPLGDPGLRRRTAQVSQWIDRTGPRLVVVDVSVEIALLARLHGVPVASFVLPGRRTDRPHRMAFDLSDRLLAAWPPAATTALLPGLPSDVVGRIEAVGAISRFPPARERPRRAARPRAVVLTGAGGSALTERDVAGMVDSAPGWEWTICGPPGEWYADPWPLLRSADVVVCHAGQNAIAEVASARRPAVVVPQARPHDEQVVTGRALGSCWPVIVEDTLPRHGWQARLDRASELDGAAWSSWCDGGGAGRAAALLGGRASGEGAA